MNRLITTAVAGLTLSVLATGTAVAAGNCTAAPQTGPASQSKPAWEYYEATEVIPAGYFCKDEVVITDKGQVRPPYTINKHGKEYIVFESGKDFTTTVHNPRTNKTVVKDTSGDFYDHLVKGGRDSETIGKGNNVIAGKGVRGIVYMTGYQEFYVKNYQTDRQKITLQVVKGKYVELCAKVGSKPVNGKNPVPQPV